MTEDNRVREFMDRHDLDARYRLPLQLVFDEYPVISDELVLAHLRTLKPRYGSHTPAVRETPR